MRSIYWDRRNTNPWKNGNITLIYWNISRYFKPHILVNSLDVMLTEVRN